jgi:hypothetical protein
MPPSFGNTGGAAPEPTRLRQIALVTKDLDAAEELLVSTTFNIMPKKNERA